MVGNVLKKYGSKEETVTKEKMIGVGRKEDEDTYLAKYSKGPRRYYGRKP